MFLYPVTRRFLLAVCILVGVFSFTGCSKEFQLSEKQDIVFEVVIERSPFNGVAWRGYYIDRDGNIFELDWQLDKKRGSASHTKAYAGALKIGLVPQDKMSELIMLLADPNINFREPRHLTGCHDLGMSKYYAYRYDEKSDIYMAELLYATGDYREKNKTINGRVLVDELKQVLNLTNDYPEGCN